MTGRLTLLLSMLAAVVAPGGAEAFVLKRTEAGAVVHWSERRVVLRVDRSLRARFRHGEAEDALRMAAEAWRGYPGVPDVVVEPGAHAPPGYEPGEAEQVHGVYLVPESEWAYDRELLAVTVTTFEESTGRVLDADILLNGGHRFELLDERRGGSRRAFDVCSVFAHEIGHLLGLGESDVAESTMWPRTRRGETEQRTLEQDDEDGVIALYTAAAAAPPATMAGCSAGGARGAGSPAPWALALALLAIVAARRTAHSVAPARARA